MIIGHKSLNAYVLNTHAHPTKERAMSLIDFYLELGNQTMQQWLAAVNRDAFAATIGSLQNREHELFVSNH